VPGGGVALATSDPPVIATSGRPRMIKMHDGTSTTITPSNP
jgi:hypothetical protein